MVAEGLGDIYFVQTSLQYDPEKLEFIGAELTGLSESWHLIVPELDESEANISGNFNMGAFSIEPLSESGAVFELKFVMLDRESDTELNMYGYRVNEYSSYSARVMITPQTIPDEYSLEQNYPNPFNPETTIRFALKEGGHVKLEIYNIMGRKVCTLVDNYLEPGVHEVLFNGFDRFGGELASGLYFYRLDCNDFHAVKKMVLLK